MEFIYYYISLFYIPGFLLGAFRMFFVLNIFDRSQVLTHKAAQRVPG
jgi:hypothetical protein